MNMVLKKISTITLSVTVLLLLFSGTAHALTPKTFTCADLNEPHSEFIITILEENIGTESQFSLDNETNIINCVRKTECKRPSYDPQNPEKDLSNIQCNSSYAATSDCSPTGNVGGEGAIFCSRVQAIISVSGLSMLFSYIGLIYRWAAGIVGIISVMFLIYGGFMMITAGDSSENIDKAKGKIVQSLTGLILLFLSAIILYTINPTFFTL